MVDNKKFARFMMACREDAVHTIFEAEAAVHKMTLDNPKKRADMSPQGDGEEPQDNSYIYQVVGNVAVIEIKGRLVNADNWYNQYCGILSYNEIRRAYALAYADPNVKYILEDYDGPGGYVSGMKETADFMVAVGKVKPRYAFVGSNASSATYFLAMGAEKIYTTDMAELGSIGVVMVNVEYSTQMKTEGVTATVIRSGDLKMVGNPYEKLSEDSKTYFNEQVMYTADIFFSSLSTARSIPRESMDSSGITTGRTFIGEQAVQIGLADGIDTFDNMLAVLQKKVDNSTQQMNNGSNSLILTANGGEMNRQMLSVADVATLAAGVVNGVTVVAPAPAAAPEKQAEQETTTIEAMAAEVIKPVEMSAVDLLKEQLETEKVAAKEATAKFTAAETARLAAEAKTAEADVTANTLKGIAAAAVNNMLVALGRGTEDLTKSSATDIAGRHAAVHADFTKNFPVGGVTGSAVAEENKTTKTSRNSLSAAQVAAVGFAD